MICTHIRALLTLTALAILTPGLLPAQETFTLKGRILDAADGAPLAARLYIQSEDGAFHFATSPLGDAVTYEKTRGEKSKEIHTTLSAHPFEAVLPAGTYTLTAEHGKEYFPQTQKITLGADTPETTLALRRWVDMNKAGWFSGETHVHRPISELPTLMLAENLNVALPLTAWVSKNEDTPLLNNRNKEPIPPAEVIHVDDTHVIWPLNTEYEINSVNKKPHKLGALFVLNHREPLDLPATPVGPIAIEARKQGALLDLDKHNWPWSMSLVPAVRVDLFEVTNNHIWRTDFAFKDFQIDNLPDYMNVERTEEGYTERGWIDFGLKTWYALLNCGLDMKPSAGTASGVHPVPLGFGRVYVKLEGPFRYESWINGLREGRSFVTTGPMLVTRFNGRNPGARLQLGTADQGSLHLTGEALGIDPFESVEILVNGDVVRTIPSDNRANPAGTYAVKFDTLIPIEETSWVAVRTFAKRSDGRQRFAHSAPVHVEIPDKPLRPKRAEVEYLISRARDEVGRHEGVLSPRAVAEFKKALRFYEDLLETAR